MHVGIRATIAASAILALSSTLAGCGGDSSADEDGPIQILSVAGYTGLFASPAKAVERGMKAAIDEINADGGIGGRKVELVTKDDQSDAQRALTLIQKAIDSNDPPDLIVPGTSSAEALAVAPLLSRQRFVGIGASSSSELDDPKKFPYYFSQSSSQEAKLAEIAQYIKGRGDKKVAVVVGADAMGEGITAGVKQEFPKAGLDYDILTFTADSVDLSPQFSAAKAKRPDIILTDGAGGQVAQILSGRVKAGAEDVPTLGGSSMALLPVLDLAKGTDQLENMVMAYEPGGVWVDPSERSASFSSFQKRVLAQGKLELPIGIYGFGWDIVQTYKAAVENVKGEVTQEKVKDSLENLPASVTDSIVLYKTLFSADSHQVRPASGDLRIGAPVEERDGQYVIEDSKSE